MGWKRGIDPPWWWKPWLKVWYPAVSWWYRPRPFPGWLDRVDDRLHLMHLPRWFVPAKWLCDWRERRLWRGTEEMDGFMPEGDEQS